MIPGRAGVRCVVEDEVIVCCSGYGLCIRQEGLAGAEYGMQCANSG